MIGKRKRKDLEIREIFEDLLAKCKLTRYPKACIMVDEFNNVVVILDHRPGFTTIISELKYPDMYLLVEYNLTHKRLAFFQDISAHPSHNLSVKNISELKIELEGWVKSELLEYEQEQCKREW